ncbi:MAG: hypothetical protein JSR33_11340, partial [Proteobacteria bacterium]|nr:hypothetical protein [Pseudomonadota bacterium]
MSKFLKNINLLILAVAAVAGLATFGCVYAQDANDVSVLKPIAPKTKEQKLKVYNYLLSEQGVDVVDLGDSHTIIIPSDSLFTAGSANFKSQYLRNLKIAARLINVYSPIQIAVNAYTSGSGEAKKALT